jgi:hypothetical protein
MTAAAARALIGAGLIFGTVGGGSVLLLLLNPGMALLGRYARLHYRLIKPERDLPAPANK